MCVCLNSCVLLCIVMYIPVHVCELKKYICSVLLCSFSETMITYYSISKYLSTKHIFIFTFCMQLYVILGGFKLLNCNFATLEIND